MTWLNPAAFLALLALAVPILVHLFGRRIAKRQRFPSLRLLVDSRPTPATRSRPSDLLLLVIRCSIVLAAVLALAQPLWSTGARMRDASIPARLILVDTGASMRRTSDGRVLRDLAGLTAQRLLDSAREGMIVETERPGANVAGAASWLSQRSGLRELVVLSDFQVGALNDGDLAASPQGLGVSLRRVGAPMNSVATIDADSSAAISANAEATMTHGTWRLSGTDSVPPFTVIAAPPDSEKVRAMVAAVRFLVPKLGASANRVVIAFPGSAMSQGASSTRTSPWQGDLLLSLRGNRLLADAMHAVDDMEPSCLAQGAVVAHHGFGFHAASVMAADSGLVVQSCARAGSVAGTALVAAVATGLASVPAFTEREPSALPDETLRSWERSPTEVAPRGREETSPDGRWFWLLAIALLAIEHVLRKGKPAGSITRATEARRERVA